MHGITEVITYLMKSGQTSRNSGRSRQLPQLEGRQQHRQSHLKLSLGSVDVIALRLEALEQSRGIYTSERTGCCKIAPKRGDGGQ